MRDDFDLDDLLHKPISEEDIEKAKKRQLEEEQLARSYKRMMTTADGKLIYKDLLARCQVFHNSFRAENTKVQDFLEGARSIGLYLMDRCELSTVDDFKKLEGE